MPEPQTPLLPSKAPTLFGAKRVGQECLITVGEKPFRATYLGSGRFTAAFERKEKVYLYTFHNDFSKSILAQTYKEFGKGNPHLPKIMRLGRMIIEDQEVNMYQGRYYRKVFRTQLSKENKRILTILQEAHDDTRHDFNGNIVHSMESEEFNRGVIGHAVGIPDSMKLALEHLTSVALDWGDHYIFDNFHVRNMGLNGREKLVLLDPMFDMEKIQNDFDYRKRNSVK